MRLSAARSAQTPLIYIYNASFYQDRLGANIGKAIQNALVLCVRVLAGAALGIRRTSQPSAGLVCISSTNVSSQYHYNIMQ